MAVLFMTCPDSEVESSLAVNMLEQFGAKMEMLSEAAKSDFSDYCRWYASREAESGAAAERVEAILGLPNSLGWNE